MKLTDEQLQLLHAKLDGQLMSEEEEAEAQELLEDAGVQEYFDTCLKVQNLVKQHAAVKAPLGLRTRVLAEIPKGKVQNISDYNWRGGWIAAAAAVVVSVGVMFGLNSNEPPQTPTVATERGFEGPREVVSDSPAETSRPIGGGLGGTTPPDKGSNTKDIDPNVDAHTEDNVSANGGRSGNKATVPGQPKDPATEVESTARTSRDGKRTVLNLDRGRDVPMSLNLHLNRAQTISVDQAYNELLMVTAMYGDAELQEVDTETFEDEEFDGNDFSSVDGILISIPEEELDELLASVNRMAGDQKFGRVAVPADLSNDVKSIEDSLKSEFARDEAVDKRHALGYAPRRTRELVQDPEPRIEPEDVTEGTNGDSSEKPDKEQDKSRKVKLLLRLR
ncbi:MAG: hypothetical protein ACYTDT_06075 [Planctomycetota bacterium]